MTAAWLPRTANSGWSRGRLQSPSSRRTADFHRAWMGTVSCHPPLVSPRGVAAAGQIQLATFVNPGAGMNSLGGNLYMPTDSLSRRHRRQYPGSDRKGWAPSWQWAGRTEQPNGIGGGRVPINPDCRAQTRATRPIPEVVAGSVDRYENQAGGTISPDDPLQLHLRCCSSRVSARHRVRSGLAGDLARLQSSRVARESRPMTRRAVPGPRCANAVLRRRGMGPSGRERMERLAFRHPDREALQSRRIQSPC